MSWKILLSLICSSLSHYTTKLNEIHSNYHILTMHFWWLHGWIAGTWWQVNSILYLPLQRSCGQFNQFVVAMGTYSSFSVLLTVVQNFSSTGMTQIICPLCCLVLWGYKLVVVSLDTNSSSHNFFPKNPHLDTCPTFKKTCLILGFSSFIQTASGTIR